MNYTNGLISLLIRFVLQDTPITNILNNNMKKKDFTFSLSPIPQEF